MQFTSGLQNETYDEPEMSLRKGKKLTKYPRQNEKSPSEFSGAFVE